MEDIIKMRNQIMQLNAIMKERLDEMNNMMNNDTEQWKVIDGFERYEISNYGKVYDRTAGRILKTYFSRNGFVSVSMRANDGKQKQRGLHRLVAEHFVCNPDKKHQVDHKDGKVCNNHYLNLEWCSIQKQNVKLPLGLRPTYVSIKTYIN